jgi:hypothetical protein
VSLVAPIFLAALGLLVPILVTFLVRRQRNVVRVPSTMVWRLGARSITKNRRIRDLRRFFALLACLGGVSALVFAAARPSGERGGTTVFVVDVSSSMEGAPLAEARGWLVREVATLGNNARVAIVLASEEPRVALPPTQPGAIVDEAIRKLAAEKGTGSIDEAVTFAEALAGARQWGEPPRVIVLSDRAVEANLGLCPNQWGDPTHPQGSAAPTLVQVSLSTSPATRASPLPTSFDPRPSYISYRGPRATTSVSRACLPALALHQTEIRANLR